MDLPGWLQIESTSCSPISLSALLCSSIPLHYPQPCQNPVVLHSLKIWSQFCKNYGLVPIWVYAPVMANHIFPGSLLDSTFIQWSKNGVLYGDSNFMLFDQFRQTFALPTNSFFRYLQVRHFVQSPFNQFPSLPQTSLDAVLEVRPEAKGTISGLYTNIFDMEAVH